MQQIYNDNISTITEATDKGDLLGDTVQFKISVQYNSGGFTDVLQILLLEELLTHIKKITE